MQSSESKETTNSMEFTKVFHKLAETEKRYVIQQGGTRSSKTHSMLQYLYWLAEGYKEEPIIISVVAESFPHLKRGAMRDFFKILESSGLYRRSNHNKSDSSYKIGKAIIEFFSVDNESKVRGASRDYLFENECNNISYQTHSQLVARTKKRIFLDYNPVSEFWVHDKILGVREGEYDYIHSTYKDNEYLSEAITKEIESRKDTDPNWWKVFGLGEVGSLEGVVYSNWDQVEEIPKEAELIGYGLDFGYTNDPTALIEIWKFNNEIYAKELLYETRLTNPDIAKKLESLNLNKNTEIIADSAEPKSIDEIYSQGWNIQPVAKGADSIMFGIDIVKQHKIHVTSGSLNLIKELRNYSYSRDKDGHQVNKPVDNWNHALDALRYLCMMKLTKQAESIPVIKFV